MCARDLDAVTSELGGRQGFRVLNVGSDRWESHIGYCVLDRCCVVVIPSRTVAVSIIYTHWHDGRHPDKTNLTATDETGNQLPTGTPTNKNQWNANSADRPTKDGDERVAGLLQRSRCLEETINQANERKSRKEHTQKVGVVLRNMFSWETKHSGEFWRCVTGSHRLSGVSEWVVS